MELLLMLFALIVMEMKQNSGLNRGGKNYKIAKKELGIKKPTMIRYDIRDLVIMRITIVVLAVIELVGIITMFSLAYSPVMDDVYERIAFGVLGRSILLCFGTILVMTIFYYFEAVNYLRGLESHRFYVPERKGDFYYALEGLPRAEEEDDGNIIPVEKGLNIESIKLSIITGVTALGMLTATGVYYYKWHEYSEKSWMFYGFFCACWIIGTWFYYRQADENVYKDECDIEIEGKKVRRSFGSGVSVYLFYLGFTVIIMMIIWQITGFWFDV